jgi:Right handed beta helix region
MKTEEIGKRFIGKVFSCRSALLAFGVGTLALFCAHALRSADVNRVVAGEFYVEPPTLENLGFDWKIEGDANRNASVQVVYRKKGDSAWKQAMPLVRLQDESVIGPGFKEAGPYIAPNMFSGSIFDLQPDTDYEAKFKLSDPDGVSGKSQRIVTVHTRPEPVPATGGRTFHVYPFDWTGPKQEPSFKGLYAAYYTASVGGDWYNAFPPRVRPGDVILVHAGLYKDKRFKYAHEGATAQRECCDTTGDGTYYLTAKGTPDKPIVIKAAGDGEVIFDGDGNNNLFNVMAADYNYFEGITFRNSFIVFEAGFKNIAGAKGITVKHCKFYDIGIGVHTDWEGSGFFYIADNDFTGRHDPMHFTSGFGADMLSQFAVKVYGSGNVIAYNRVRNFHDGLDHATYGLPVDWPNTPWDRIPKSNDFYNNDISNMHDNCMEADGSAQNTRVMRNLCANNGGQAYSLQPQLGGPAYFIRNIAYNSPRAGVIKFSESPAGGIFYHNTFFENFSPGANAFGSNMHLRNNLILRQYEGAPVLQMPTFTSYSTSDYNGFYAGPGSDPFMWNSPPTGTIRIAEASQARTQAFGSLEQYAQAVGQDTHSIMIDFTIFENVKPVDKSAPATTVYDPDTLDFRLKGGAAAIDKGVVLPNINDGFSGTAPDLGAIEEGQPLPHYGPRQ